MVTVTVMGMGADLEPADRHKAAPRLKAVLGVIPKAGGVSVGVRGGFVAEERSERELLGWDTIRCLQQPFFHRRADQREVRPVDGSQLAQKISAGCTRHVPKGRCQVAVGFDEELAAPAEAVNVLHV